MPRHNLDDLELLRNSMKAAGTIKPIIVRPIEGRKFEFVADEGHRNPSQGRLELINRAKGLARDIFKDNLVKMEMRGSIVSGVKPFRRESDIDVGVWLKDARLGSGTLSRTKVEEPQKLIIGGHKIHFLRRGKERLSYTNSHHARKL